METVFRAALIYLVLLAIFRIAGRRTLSDISTFDFVLLMMIGESTQQALLGEDFSLTNAILIIVSLVVMDIGFSLGKKKWRGFARLVDGMPMVLVDHGRFLHQRMRRARVQEGDVLQAAREFQGLERVEQIKFAVLEVSGCITIIPTDESRQG